MCDSQRVDSGTFAWMWISSSNGSKQAIRRSIPIIVADRNCQAIYIPMRLLQPIRSFKKSTNLQSQLYKTIKNIWKKTKNLQWKKTHPNSKPSISFSPSDYFSSGPVLGWLPVVAWRDANRLGMPSAAHHWKDVSLNDPGAFNDFNVSFPKLIQIIHPNVKKNILNIYHRLCMVWFPFFLTGTPPTVLPGCPVEQPESL